FLSRTTAVLATLFFVTSLGLAAIARQQEVPTSLLDETAIVPSELEALPELDSLESADSEALPEIPDLDDVQLETEVSDVPALPE
ncbi:MAG: preprotein translocase subunit SecG, partial [Gammaproteobacteria bacterium]